MAFQECARFRQGLTPSSWYEIEAGIDEAGRLYAVWDALDDAWMETRDEGERRRALGVLREHLGPEAWAAARMPFCVPRRLLWRGE